MYFVYVDQTTEGIPYYVGYGNIHRLNFLKRNKKHQAISKKYGHVRTIVHETLDSKEAKSFECWWIEQCATYVHHPLADKFACNFTTGGEGTNGQKFSDLTKTKMSLAKRGKPSKRKGTRLSVEHCKNISIAKKGLKRKKNKNRRPPISENTRQAISKANSGDENPFYGKRHTIETILKIKAKRAIQTFSIEERIKRGISQKRRYAKWRAETGRDPLPDDWKYLS